HFLLKRALHLKSVAISAAFSLAGLILFCFHYAILFITPLFEIKTNPPLADVITEIHLVFGGAFPFLVIALAEAFLALWLVNSIKKMRLRLDVIWAGFLEEIAGR
ncbi:MAG: hypothetical protein OEW18_12330, partial [Candidatus Aminicenantes bacterium]|nr:hypothetical protein [Candidatus Aminicenantes bacterium]